MGKVKLYADNLSSLTRPIWDKPEKPFNIIPHYYAPHIGWSDLCALHNWKPVEKAAKVYDATLFSIELELLEIRLKELIDVVDYFLILESNSTFTGLPKEYVYALNKDRFKFAHHKIIHRMVEVPPLKPGEDPFTLERIHRAHMTKFLHEVNVADGDWVLMMDVDEIPSWHTVELLRSCTDIPSPLHLQLRNYLYSFEFMLDMDSWRGKAVRFPFPYGHIRESDDMLADAGWHCSYCFKTIKEFEFKMLGFSHADRVHSKKLLNPSHIQDVICKGSNIFQMIPEAFSYKDLVSKWGNAPKQYSAISLPKAILREPKKFAFLLPGGCKREDSPK